MTYNGVCKKVGQEEIKEKMHEIKSKMMLIEWDKERSLAFSKDRIYKELKEEYEKLEKELKDEEKSGS